MKKKRFLAVFLLLAMIIGGLQVCVPAKADIPFIVSAGAYNTFDAVPGEVTHMCIPVQLGTNFYNISYGSMIMVNITTETGIFDTTQGFLTLKADGVVPDYNVGIEYARQTFVEFDLKVHDTTAIGSYAAQMNFSFVGYDYSSGDSTLITEASVPFHVRILRELAPAQLTVERMNYDKNRAAAGGNFKLDFDVVNGGEICAYNTFVRMDYGDSGMIPDYSLESIKVGDVGPGGSMHVSLPIRVQMDAAPGVKSVTVHFTYKNIKGEEQNSSKVIFINLEDQSKAPVSDANLKAESIQFNSEVERNSAYEVGIVLENIGEKTASNIRVVIAEASTGVEKGILPQYPDAGVEIAKLRSGEKTTVKLPLLITKSANTGLTEFVVQISYEDSLGNVLTSVTRDYITILGGDDTPVSVEDGVVISDITQTPEKPISGEMVTLEFTLTNKTGKTIYGASVYGENLSADGFEPMDANVTREIGDLAAGESKKISLSYFVGSKIAAGTNQLSLAIQYTDANGNKKKETQGIYVLNVQQVTSEQIKNSIIISDISQNPLTPVVNEKVTVSFVVTNNGNKTIEDLKFKGTGLGKSGFEPVSSEIYKEVGNVASGESKKVSMTFKVGSEIPEGFNTLSLEYSYVDGAGVPQSETVSFYILNVKAESSVNTSRPKLIVSDFSTSIDELRAGSLFDFTFDLKNTHPSKQVKNIKVTVTQSEGVFTNVSGSNSFYIDAIAPGESYEHTMGMKVKSDTATGAYDIQIEVEYEYDDMSQTDAAAGGVTDKSMIRMQAVENARPAVQNLSVGYMWDTPKVNQATTMTFDFYNMGKSTLDNVYITMEGDFMFESGSMHIIGSVSAGSSSTQEVSVIPMMEGTCTGTITVHFEDSNGDEVTKDFDMPQVYVEGDYSGGGEWVDPGNWGEPDVPVDVPAAKEPIFPVWVYALILAGTFVFGIIITRAIVIKVHKAKMNKEEE